MTDEKMAFHRKYRPVSVSGYIGNEKLKSGVMSLLAKGERPQSWLFYGASGCGKTTFARLLLKEYMCENRDDVKGACGECAACRQADYFIQTGDTTRSIGIREIDIADQSGKKDIGGVLEEMQIPSYMGVWKVYIFDECHMATEGAQNRMLKAVEEPPENVLMLFCTTNPEKLIPTLRNRCVMQYEVKKPAVSELSGLLSSVCEKEGIRYDLKGLNFIAERGGLVIRSALTGLDRVAAEKGNVLYNTVTAVLEGVNDALIIGFYEKLLRADNDIMGYVVHISKIKGTVGLGDFVRELLEFTKRGIYVINGMKVEGVTKKEIAMYIDLFGSFSMGEIGSIMSTLMGLDGDIEAKLLLWGYTGLTSLAQIEKSDPGGLMPVMDKNDELRQEKECRGKEIRNTRTEAEELGLVAAGDLTGEASLDDILGMFGGTSVNL